MLDGLGDYVALMRTALADSQRQIAESRQRIQRLEVRTDSKDGSVSVTVNGTGDLTELTFRDDSYADLTPAELSDLLLATIREAKAELQRSLLESLPASPVTGLTPAQLMDPSTDIPAALPADPFAWLGGPGAAGGLRV